MAFGTFELTKYPKRHWALKGPATYGKSTFAGQMAASADGSAVVVDTDNRFEDIVRTLALEPSKTVPISNERDAHINTDKASAILRANKGADVGLVIVDSLTGIIQPKITAAQNLPKKENGIAMNDKARTMRVLVDALQNFGADYLLIWHEEARSDQRGEDTVHQTLPLTERDALYRALTMVLQTVAEKDGNGSIVRYGIHVEWARDGEYGFTLWDEPGNRFKGMPERIEAAVYAKGVRTDANPGPGVVKPAPTIQGDSISKPAPRSAEATPAPKATATGSEATTFPNRKAAIEWAVAQGYCTTQQEAVAEYEQVKAQAVAKGADCADKVFTAWILHLKTRGTLVPAEIPATAPDY